MRNSEVSRLLYDISEMLELSGENIFKIRAYSRAARTIEGITEDIVKIAKEKRLEEIPGVGEAIASKIEEYLATGKLVFYEDLKKQVPTELHELMQIPGIGPKTVQYLHKELGIKSVKELKKAAREHRLRRISHFGAVKEENLLKSIERYRHRSTRIPLGTALPIVKEIADILKKSGYIEMIEPAGSLRRRKETVGDIDILATSQYPEAAIETFVHLPVVKDILAKGSTKAVILTHEDIQVDLRIMDRNSIGTSLQYFTGSKEHNINLRDLARKKGFKLSEYDIEEISTGRKIYCETEEEVYELLGLSLVPPEIREDSGEIELALKRELPELVELGDIKGDFHVHTNWSEGTDSIPEMVEAAKKLGYEYIAITDHSRALGVAHGMSEERLFDQIKEINKLNDKLDDFHIFAGIEVDIKADAKLDLPGSILKQCEVVIAALHTGQRQARREITNRLLTAMENENVDIIAHPTGRIIGKREEYDVDIDVLLDTAARTGTVLEINAHPARLDLSDINSRKGKNKGVRFEIGTDAHSALRMENMEFGVNVARRGWLEKKDVMNSRSYRDVRFKSS